MASVLGNAQTLSFQKLSADVITFQADLGKNYAIQSSTNLVDWSPVDMIDGHGSIVRYTNIVAQQAQMFYRTVVTTSQGVILQISATSPQTRIVKISESTETDNVLLFKGEMRSPVDGTLRQQEAIFTINGNRTFDQVFSDAKLRIAGITYSFDSRTNIGASVPGESTNWLVRFSSLASPLPANIYRSFDVLGRIAKNENMSLEGVWVAVSVVASGTFGGTTNNPLVEDGFYNTVGISSTVLEGSKAIFTSGEAFINGTSTQIGSPIVNNNQIVAYPVEFQLSITAGDNTLYVSKYTPTAFSTTVGPGQDNIFVPTDITASPTLVAGDTDNYYVIPAGSTREFSVFGTLYRGAGSGLASIQVTAIRFGLSAGSLDTYTINWGLENLRATVQF